MRTYFAIATYLVAAAVLIRVSASHHLQTGRNRGLRRYCGLRAYSLGCKARSGGHFRELTLAVAQEKEAGLFCEVLLVPAARRNLITLALKFKPKP